jgi:hypothetical protein
MAGASFDVNDATSTKQDLGALPFLLVAGSDFTNYWHNTLALVHPPPVVTPTPTVTATPTPTPTTTPGPQPPALTALSVSPRSFRVAPGRPRPARGLGTRVRVGVSRDAAVELRVQRRMPGRRVGGSCVAIKHSNLTAPKCTRYGSVSGRLSRTVRAGVRSITFSGRLGGRPLSPAAYRFVAVARADGLASAPRRAAFRIVRARTSGT